MSSHTSEIKDLMWAHQVRSGGPKATPTKGFKVSLDKLLSNKRANNRINTNQKTARKVCIPAVNGNPQVRNELFRSQSLHEFYKKKKKKEGHITTVSWADSWKQQLKPSGKAPRAGHGKPHFELLVKEVQTNEKLTYAFCSDPKSLAGPGA